VTATTSPGAAVPCSRTAGLLTEGPRWDAERDELLWVDIVGARLHRGRPDANGLLEESASIQLDRFVGAVAPAVGGGYVIAAHAGFLFLDASGGVIELAQPEAGRTHVRMNDGACDPQGRFWAGTMAFNEAPGEGMLHRLELDGTCTTVLTGLTISNGIGWSPDGTRMYLSDSGTATIDAFDFDPVTGDISARGTIVQIVEEGVAPDGLTIDEEGNIWVALWGGSAVRRYSPDGSLLCTVPMPVERPTSCAFGRPERTTLFITTAQHGLDDAALARQPDAGRVFRVDGLGTRGPACAPYRGRIVPRPSSLRGSSTERSWRSGG
jgi:sugar lactone lactonase YvrE